MRVVRLNADPVDSGTTSITVGDRVDAVDDGIGWAVVRGPVLEELVGIPFGGVVVVLCGYPFDFGWVGPVVGLIVGPPD